MSKNIIDQITFVSEPRKWRLSYDFLVETEAETTIIKVYLVRHGSFAAVARWWIRVDSCMVIPYHLKPYSHHEKIA